MTLPVATTLVLGHQFEIKNNSTGIVTVNSSGANVVLAIPSVTTAVFTCILASGTTAASWSVSSYLNTPSAGGGTPKAWEAHNTMLAAHSSTELYNTFSNSFDTTKWENPANFTATNYVN